MDAGAEDRRGPDRVCHTRNGEQHEAGGRMGAPPLLTRPPTLLPARLSTLSPLKSSGS